MLRIRSLDDAKTLWNQFNKKYENLELQQGITSEQKLQHQKKLLHYQKKLTDDEAKKYMDQLAAKPRSRTAVQTASDRSFNSPDFDERNNQAATKIQRFLRTRRQIPVNLNGNHDHKILHLVNGQKIKRSSDFKKMQELKKALDEGDWENIIFNNNHVREYALSLYAAKKITQQQMFTILDREQTFEIYPNQKTHKILDENNQFTKEALIALLPIISNRYIQKRLTAEQLESFRLLIATLPPSEQTFYIVEHIENKGSTQLRKTLQELDAILTAGNYTLRLSSGARDAVGLTRFGFENYVRVLPRFGQQSIDDIKRHVQNRTRPGATAYPGTIPYQDIHDDREANVMEAFDHDVYHTNVMSTVCEYFPDVFPYLMELCQNSITVSGKPLNWSKEIWMWVDGDYPFFYHYNKVLKSPADLTLKESTSYFCSWLNHRSGDEYEGAFLLKRNGWDWEGGDLTPIGVVALIDMIENKDKWKKLKVDPDALDNGFEVPYNTIQSIYPHLENRGKKIQILKYFIYQSLQRHKMEDRFTLISQKIDEHADTLEKSLAFKKVGKKDLENGVPGFRINTVYLTYKNADVVQSGIIPGLLEDIHQLKQPNASPESHARFANGCLYRNLDENQAEHFSQLTNKSKKEAEFIAKPTTRSWLGFNRLSSFLAIVSIVGIVPLYFYVQSQVNNQKQQNEKMTKTKTNSTTPTRSSSFSHRLYQPVEQVESQAEGELKNQVLTRPIASQSS